MKVTFISVRLRDTGFRCPYFRGHELATAPARGPRPAWLGRPGPLEALDQGHHAVVQGRGYPHVPSRRGYAAGQDIDLGGPARENVLQHARLVVVRLRDGLVHGLPWRPRQDDPRLLADHLRLRDQPVDLQAKPGVGA